MREAIRILVIKGGPAGSTAAGLLAKEGFKVTHGERERFPRYHIFKSILPSCRPILELLGGWRKIQNYGFQHEGSVYFLWFWAIPLHDGTTSVGLVTGRDNFNRQRHELGGLRLVLGLHAAQAPAASGWHAGATR
jgi:2-polyprenyl-6-methoxyphenol hydroxylase-like FAD-dependent oxidoreductase